MLESERTLITVRPCILVVTLPSITQYRTSQGDCMLSTKFMYILMALYSISFIGNTVNVDFWVGRKDCNQNPVPKRTFIQHNEMDGIQKLAELFDLNEKEAVALMGNLKRLAFLVSH